MSDNLARLMKSWHPKQHPQDAMGWRRCTTCDHSKELWYRMSCSVGDVCHFSSSNQPKPGCATQDKWRLTETALFTSPHRYKKVEPSCLAGKFSNWGTDVVYLSSGLYGWFWSLWKLASN